VIGYKIVKVLMAIDLPSLKNISFKDTHTATDFISLLKNVKLDNKLAFFLKNVKNTSAF